MDSLTQIILGSSVGELVLGKKIGNKAILWGAIAGTIPDLDVVLNFLTDDISATEMHRGFSHSILFALLITPILGYIAKKIHKKEYDVNYKNWMWFFFWITITHSLLDAHTTWGTQLFWPFDYRVAYQNIFVIDPFYTLPFLCFLVLAMFYKKTNLKRRKLNKLGLIISSSYIVITLLFKWVAHSEFKASLNNQKIEYNEIDTKPTPLNSILWSALIETETGYRTAYYSLLDKKEIEFSKEFPKNHQLLKPFLDQKIIKQLINISNGWYFIEKKGDNLIFRDLRFGQLGMDVNTAPFLWFYELTIDDKNQISATRKQPDFKKMDVVFSDLYERIKGN